MKKSRKKEEILALPEELTKLLEAGVHFGHQAKRWNPKMEKFIFGKRSGIYIIDLEKTLVKLKEAQEFLRGVVGEGKDILFVGTKKQAQGVIRQVAESLNMPYVVERWVGGLLTNFEVVSSRIAKYKELLKAREEGRFDELPKKEVVRLNRELERMERNFSGLKHMEELPGALFVVDPKKEYLSVREARKVGLPIVALVDTDSDPEVIDYPIPGNDDALKSIKTIISFIADAVGEILVQNKEKETKPKEEKRPEGPEAKKIAKEYEEVEEKLLEEEEKKIRRADSK